MRMEWEKTDATTDEAPGKARAGEPTAAQAGEILKKAADTPSTVPGAAQAEKSAVGGRTPNGNPRRGAGGKNPPWTAGRERKSPARRGRANPARRG